MKYFITESRADRGEPEINRPYVLPNDFLQTTPTTGNQMPSLTKPREGEELREPVLYPFMGK